MLYSFSFANKTMSILNLFLHNIYVIFFLLIFLYNIFKCFLNNISQLVKILINKKLLKNLKIVK